MNPLLRQLLSQHTVSELKDLTAHLPDISLVGRKDELLDRIVGAMLGGARQNSVQPTGIQSVWALLDDTQRAAVAEAVHHLRGEYSHARFRAKYQRAPSFKHEHRNAYGHVTKKPSALNLFLMPRPGESQLIVPGDLAALLRTFVPPPAPLRLESEVDDPNIGDIVIRCTEREATQELMEVLRTIDQTKVGVSDKTALPTAAATRLLSGALVGGDFYPADEPANDWDQVIGPMRAFAWPMLLQAAGLVERTGTRLTLTAAGRKVPGRSPAESLRSIWSKWMKTTLLDEFSRIDIIKGQAGKGRVMTAVAPRRAMVVEALRQCPVGRWVRLDELSRFMRATDLHFDVTHDAWRLYVLDRQYGALGYDGFHNWGILQGRYIAALLFEYAATLGLIDVAYVDPKGAMDDFRELWGVDDLAFLSRYDGLSHFRLNALGAYVMDMVSEYRPPAPKRRVHLTVLPSLAIRLAEGELSAADRMLLENWAEPVADGGWRLDRPRALMAIERGLDATELRALLETGDNMPLPEPVDAFLRQTEIQGNALRPAGEAVLFECQDTATAEAVASHKETAAFCLRAGANTLVVRSEHLTRFRERLRGIGYGIAAVAVKI